MEPTSPAISDETGCTRREFLEWTGGAALAAAGFPATLPSSRPSGFGPGVAFATVVEVQHSRVLRGLAINGRALRDMFRTLLVRVTGQRRPSEAWHSLLRDDDVIGLKFNHVGASVLGTNVRLAGIIIKSLLEAGFKPAQLVLIELPERLAQQFETTPAAAGWQSKSVTFAGREDHLAAVLDQVTALINVPVLKTHRIAAMSGALKNISHALVRHPARYHANGCDPWIGAINALAQIRSKVRLHVGNALRVVYDAGPEATPENVATCSTLLGSTDPVALDAVGWEVLQAVRRLKNLPPLRPVEAGPAFLATAEKLDVGVANLDAIARQSVRLA